MQTILVPLDLTAATEHTVVYANKLAVRLHAEVVLLYCHPGAELTAAAEAGFRQRLSILAERLRYVQLVRQDGRRIRYRFVVRAGCLHDHVPAVIGEVGADLLVLALEHTDCGEQAPDGNHAVRIAEQAPCPVLVVPAGPRPLPSRLVFTTDFGHVDAAALPLLGELAHSLRAQLNLVHFYRRLDLPGLISVKRGLRDTREALAGVPVDCKLVLEDDPLEGIGEFCARIGAQLLVYAPAETGPLRRFFDVCYTKTDAYHTRIPVLVLPRPAAPAEAFCCQRCAQQAHPVALAEAV
ncbi:universal stress protein [Hymenobacter sp. B81]|uniref:universal stress protein n=1 Tax=Hymenobacter sp. B81 TaxID=3344878 RepID=UPI0037DD3C1A